MCIRDSYKRLDDAATRREEWMAVKTIMDGQIPIIGNGVSKVIDFGFTNKVKLEGTKQWGKSAAKPLDDLEDWVDQVLTNGFANVDHAVMGKTALRNFLADAEVQKMLDLSLIHISLSEESDPFARRHFAGSSGGETVPPWNLSLIHI